MNLFVTLASTRAARHICPALLLVAGLGVALPVRAATIPNGGFEGDGSAFEHGNGYAQYEGNPTNITGWTKGGDLFSGFGNIPLVGVAANPGIQPSALFLQDTVAPEGTHAGFLQVYGPGSVHTTTLATTISDLVPLGQYVVTYAENARAGTSPVLDASVQVNGVDVVLAHPVAHTATFSQVTSLPFVATSASESLQFTNQIPVADGSTDASWLIDNIQITAVPEPTSLALLGVAGLLGMGRRRRF